jgi:hypothetical protein
MSTFERIAAEELGSVVESHNGHARTPSSLCAPSEDVENLIAQMVNSALTSNISVTAFHQLLSSISAGHNIQHRVLALRATEAVRSLNCMQQVNLPPSSWIKFC